MTMWLLLQVCMDGSTYKNHLRGSSYGTVGLESNCSGSGGSGSVPGQVQWVKGSSTATTAAQVSIGRNCGSNRIPSSGTPYVPGTAKKETKNKLCFWWIAQVKLPSQRAKAITNIRGKDVMIFYSSNFQISFSIFCIRITSLKSAFQDMAVGSQKRPGRKNASISKKGFFFPPKSRSSTTSARLLR